MTKTLHNVFSIIIAALLIMWYSKAEAQSALRNDTIQPNAGEADSIASGELDIPIHYFGKDSAVFDLLHNRVYLYGPDSYVSMEGMELKASRIRFDFDSKTVYASGSRDSSGKWIGRPIFKDKETQFEEDSLAFNIETKKGISYGARTQEGEAYLIAGISKRQADETISIKNGKLTTCDNPNPHYHFQLTKAVVIPNDKVVTGPFYLKVRKIPTPLALPFGFFPNKKESTHGILLPGYGDAKTKGFFLQNLGYYIPLPPYLETKILFDLYTRGSWSVRNITNYKRRYKYSGSFNISRTHNKMGLIELPSYFEQNTFNVRWTHNQDAKARPDSRFSANVNLGSSQNFRNNLNATQQDFLTGTFNSSVQWTKSFPGKPYALSLSANHTQNTQTKTTQLILPSLAINVSRINVLKNIFPKSPIGVTGTINGESLYEGKESDFSLNNMGALARKASHGIKYSTQASTSWKLGAAVTLNPSFNFNMVQGFRSVEPLYNPALESTVLDTVSKMIFAQNWSTSLTANSRLYGTWVVKKPRKLKAVRHMIQPAVGMSYTPNQNYTQRGPYGTDGTFIGYTAFDAARYKPSQTAESASINFSINQNLEAKIKKQDQGKVVFKKVKLIEGFKLSSSYNTLADSLQLNNLQVNAFTTVGQNVTLNYNSTHSFYDRDTLGHEINTFLIKQQGTLTRMEGGNLAVGLRFKGGQGKTNAEDLVPSKPMPNNTGMVGSKVDFTVPWNVNLNYNLRMQKSWSDLQRADSIQWIQALTAMGDLTLFKKWALSFNTGYDFQMKKMTTSTFALHWDLHCWEFTISAVPFGERKSYFAQLNVKASILQDLKLQKRGNLGGDTNYWAGS